MLLLRERSFIQNVDKLAKFFVCVIVLVLIHLRRAGKISLQIAPVYCSTFKDVSRTKPIVKFHPAK